MSDPTHHGLVPLAELRLLPDNPQRGHKIERLARSLERYGFGAPVTVNTTTGHVVAGNGRVKTLRKLQRQGKPPPAGITVDATGRWLVPVYRGQWTAADERQAALALNGGIDGSLTGELDRDLVAAILQEAAAEDTAALGVADQEVAQFILDTETKTVAPALELDGLETVDQDATPETTSPAEEKPRPIEPTTTLRLIVSEELGRRVRTLAARGYSVADVLIQGVDQLEKAQNERRRRPPAASDPEPTAAGGEDQARPPGNPAGGRKRRRRADR